MLLLPPPSVFGCLIQRKVGRVPARVGKRVIQGALIGDAEASAQRSLAVAQHIPGKAHAGTEVIVIPPPQGLGGRKTSRPALAGKNPPLVSRTGNVGALNLPCACRDVIDQVLSRTLQESRRQIVQLGVARVQIVAQPQVKRETPGDLPIVLEKESVLPVAKVPDVGCQPRWLTAHKAGIDPANSS